MGGAFSHDSNLKCAKIIKLKKGTVPKIAGCIGTFSNDHAELKDHDESALRLKIVTPKYIFYAPPQSAMLDESNFITVHRGAAAAGTHTGHRRPQTGGQCQRSGSLAQGLQRRLVRRVNLGEAQGLQPRVQFSPMDPFLLFFCHRVLSKVQKCTQCNDEGFEVRFSSP